MIRTSVSIGEPPIAGYGETAPTVWPAGRNASQIIRERLDFSIKGRKSNFAVPALIEFEIDPTAVLAPDRHLDVPVQIPGHDPRAGAVAIHNIEAGNLIALVLIVKAYISDLPPVRRQRRVLIWTNAIRESVNAAVADRDFVDLRIERLILPILVPVSREDDRLAIWRPSERSLVIESPVGELVGRASVRWHDKKLLVRLFQIAFLVGPINHPTNRFWWLGPFGALGLSRHLSEWLCFIRH